jgi:hypothetical protein
MSDVFEGEEKNGDGRGGGVVEVGREILGWVGLSFERFVFVKNIYWIISVH